MFFTEEQIRFHKCCCDAMFGYTSAFTAVSGVMTDQAFGFWNEASIAGASNRSSKNGSRSTRNRRVTYRRDRLKQGGSKPILRAGALVNDASPTDIFDAFGRFYAMPWLATEMMTKNHNAGYYGEAVRDAGGPMNGMPALANPASMMGAWLDMDWTRAPRCWPMAYGMMAVGIPKTVAWPMAEANLAAIDAMNIAGGAAHRVFGNGKETAEFDVTRQYFTNLGAMSGIDIQGGSVRPVGPLQFFSPFFGK